MKSYELKLSNLISLEQCSLQNNESPSGKVDSGEHSELSSPQNSASSLECIGYNEQHENLQNNVENAETKNEEIGEEIEFSRVVSDASHIPKLSPLFEARATIGLLFHNGENKHYPLPSDLPVIELPDPLSRGRGSKIVISQVLHHKFMISAIMLLGLCSLLPASVAAQTNISCGQYAFNVSLAIPWTHPQCFCSLPLQEDGLENDTRYVFEQTSLIWYQSQLFYFLFGAFFILLYLKWLRLEERVLVNGMEFEVDGMEPEIEPGVNNAISPSEATSPPQDSDLNYLMLMRHIPLFCCWAYEASKTSTSDSDGAIVAEESSIFSSSYHPPEPEQNGPNSVSETGLFVMNQNVRKARQATNPAVMIVTESLVGKPGGSVDRDYTEKIDDPITIATEESVEDANNKNLHSQEQEFVFAEIRPRMVTFDGNNSNSVLVMHKSHVKCTGGNRVYLHKQYPRLVPPPYPHHLIPSSSPPSPKPYLFPKVATQSGCGTVLQNGTKTYGCMVELDVGPDDKIELLPLHSEQSVSDCVEFSYSYYDISHLRVKPFQNNYGDD